MRLTQILDEIASDSLIEIRMYWAICRPRPRWSYEFLDGFDWENDPKPSEEQFAVFTAEMVSGERCASCGRGDFRVMQDDDGEVCYECGKAYAWSDVSSASGVNQSQISRICNDGPTCNELDHLQIILVQS